MNIEDVKSSFEISDLEVADAYNEHFVTSFASPLPDHKAEDAYLACAKAKEDRKGPNVQRGGYNRFNA